MRLTENADFKKMLVRDCCLYDYKYDRYTHVLNAMFASPSGERIALHIHYDSSHFLFLSQQLKRVLFSGNAGADWVEASLKSYAASDGLDLTEWEMVEYSIEQL